MNEGTVLLTNVLGRRSTSLDGPWHVIVDPYEMGYWGILGDRNPRGFYRDFTPRHPADRVEYDFDASPTLTVPGDWNTQDERLLYYEGTVWYRRTVTIGPDDVMMSFQERQAPPRGLAHTAIGGGEGPFAILRAASSASK